MFRDFSEVDRIAPNYVSGLTVASISVARSHLADATVGGRRRPVIKKRWIAHRDARPALVLPLHDRVEVQR